MALGAAMGRPAAFISARAWRLSGTRTATVESPAVTIAGTAPALGSTSVSGPGQNFPISFSAAFGILEKSFLALAAEHSCNISGSKRGRPFISKMRAQASGFRPSAPRPYTVSVGKATTPPARIRAAAFLILAGVALRLFTNLILAIKGDRLLYFTGRASR